MRQDCILKEKYTLNRFFFTFFIALWKKFTTFAIILLTYNNYNYA